jgi:small-conductance mechanosensitive channel
VRLRLAVVLLASLLIFVGGASAFAQAPKTSRPFSFIVADWARDLDRAEAELNNPLLSRLEPEELRAIVAQVRAAATAAKAEAEKNAAEVQRFLTAMGPPPGAAEPPEPENISKQRAKYIDDRDIYAARVSQSELAIARANVLSRAISDSAQQRLLERLLHSYPFPLAPATLNRGLADVAGRIAALSAAPGIWWNGLSSDGRDKVIFRLVVLLPLIVLAGLAIRFFLLRWLGRDPAIEAPSYTRRFTGSVAEGVAGGIIPALIFAGLLWRANSEKALIFGLFAEVATAFCLAMILVILAWALPRAVLAPDLPAWRLTSISPENSRAISRRILLLAVIFAADIFLKDAGKSLPVSPELISVFAFFFTSLESLCVIDLARGRLWETREDIAEDSAETPESAAVGIGGAFWPTVRRLIMLIAAVTIVSALIGQAALAAFLIDNLLYSAIVIGVLFLLRGLLRELVGAAFRSSFVRRSLNVRHGTRQLLKFWVRALLDGGVFLAGVFLVTSIWGSPFGDLWSWTGQLLRGFTIGNVTISLGDMAVALAVFVLVIVLTRLMQRALTDRILPKTKLDSGLQYSLSAGFGYIGLTLAAVLGIAAVGIDLSSVALIAGALSVGIGFGLQNVVNNFVSGMILLVERPIKVGDWVVVGANEGFVKRINVRATEIGTFQRASVIIPNSELLSGAVVNWTHKDRYGRVEVGVGVAYGSDTRKVRDILLDCAAQHERVLKWPEPFVVYQDFGDSSLDFELRCFTNDVLYKIIIASDLRYAIDDRFRAEGIEIPFPQRVLHYADPPVEDASETPKPRAAEES